MRCRGAMMNLHNQDRECHSERSEESRCTTSQILRCAQNDMTDFGRQSSSSRPYNAFFRHYASSISGHSSIIAWAVPPGGMSVPPSGTMMKALASSSDVIILEP